MTKQLYICDPALNKACNKKYCHANVLSASPICQHTVNIEYAKKPIEKVLLQVQVDGETAAVFNLPLSSEAIDKAYDETRKAIADVRKISKS